VLSLLGSALLVAPAALGAIHPQGAQSSFEKLLPHLATGIGSLALVAIVAWLSRRREPRRAVRWLTIAILGCVIVQGIKGGLRVELINLELAIAHGVFAQLILCLMAGLAVVTSRWWQAAPDLSAGLTGVGGRKVVTAATVAFLLVLLQLVAGATMRHYGAGLAIPDLPLAYGQLLPPTSPEAIDAANAFRVSLNDPHLKPVTRTEVLLHFSHRVGAVLVTLAVLHLCFTAFRRAKGQGKVTLLSGALLVMLAAQLTLGLLTVYHRKPADITTLHHTLGAICMMTVFVLGLRAARLYRPRRLIAPAPAPVASPTRETLSPVLT
jgi:cytochrome c oxidase assembly protein subunit 15